MMKIRYTVRETVVRNCGDGNKGAGGGIRQGKALSSVSRAGGRKGRKGRVDGGEGGREKIASSE